MAQDLISIWQCSECLTVRQWGNGQPENREDSPILKCGICKKATFHHFLKIDYRYSTEVMNAENHAKRTVSVQNR